MTIARVALPVAAAQTFDYWAPSGIDVAPGSLARVLLGRRRLYGVVVEVVDESELSPDQLSPLEEIIAFPPLSDDVRELVGFVAAYYHAPIGLVCALAVPPLGAAKTPGRRAPANALVLSTTGLRELPAQLKRAPAARALFERLADGHAVLTPDDVRSLTPTTRRMALRWHEAGYLVDAPKGEPTTPAIRLNDEQQHAVDEILGARDRFGVTLLHGVTGSGKTEVYLACAQQCIAAGGQVLMLVPEINLTPQLVARVSAALPDARTAILHSGLADGERRRHWLAAANGGADIVLGTRLAVFTPVPRLALVIVDEEHDSSYKQQDGVRYHARDAAVWRARRRGVPIVLGSATPSLESYAHAEARRYALVRLTTRADPRAATPSVRLVPSRTDATDGVSSALVEAIAARLARREQSLVFINRRGYAPSLRCVACDWQAGCPRCSARLTTHRVPSALVCHHCGHREQLPRACPNCGNVDLFAAGHGTQRLEQSLAMRFPHARIARVDRDTTRRRGSFASLRERIADNAVDILIGTQMLAKGHDFPRLTLVGVLGADNALYSSDFRATERLAALLVQVAGRAGRADLAGEVIVQTDFPNHPLFAALRTHDYDALARDLLEEREASGLPPSAHLALLEAESHRREDVDAFLAQAHVLARAELREAAVVAEVFAPVPAPLERRAGFERGQMLLRSRRRADLQRVLDTLLPALAGVRASRVRWTIDVDPASVA